MSDIGRWITNQTAVPFYARRLFVLDKKVKKAEAKVCGLGQFLFWVNGQKVGDHELDPGWTDYKKLVEYVVFDVTDYLHAGENVIGAEVGNGWFIKMDEHYTFSFPPFMPPNPNPYQPYGKSLMLAAEMNILFEDGTRMCLHADEDWRVRRHPVVMSNVYGSETMDGRLVPGDFWCTADFDASGWERASFVSEEEAPTGSASFKEMIPQEHPPVKVIHSYEGVYLGEVNGRKIYDFGQNLSGLLEFEVRGHAGDVVKVYPAEKLAADGDVDQMAKNWMNLDSCETYILGAGPDGEWERFRMKFTYFAGRYVAVEMIPGGAQALNETISGAAKAQDERITGEAETQSEALSGAAQTQGETLSGVAQGGIEIRNLVAHALTSAWKTDGSFNCDDERYNKIYDMIEKTVEANMTTGVHTDCPTIERFAWQEPNHLMAPSILFMKDGRLLWEKFLLDMRVGQHTADDWFHDMQGGRYYPGDGLMPAQCPCYIPNVLPVPGMGSFYDIIAWGSTSILGTYWHYQFYGDPKIIEDNYDAGMRYLNHLKTKVTEDGFINHGLGDWGNPRNDLVKENVETAFLYADVMTLVYFAEVLEKTSLETEGDLQQSRSVIAGNEAAIRNKTVPENETTKPNKTVPENEATKPNKAAPGSVATNRNLAKDREELLAYAKIIKDNYNQKLLTWNEEQGFWCYKAWDHPDELFMTQAAEALPLYWGLVPEDKEADVARALQYVLERDGAFISGEVGLPYVIQSARKYGMNELISRLILKEEHPSYYAFILDGETTLGEYWETNPRSHCHDMMGHIIEWYYNGIAGILCEKPGFAKVTIRPYLPESMNTFTCSYQSMKGLIRVKVTRMEKEILLNVTVPEQIEYTIDTSNLEKGGNPVEVSVA
ncbi:MAG: family 78 glycoside hydrolase catalytic domain [Clostridiales bacterium]|nr:family 78 glycoside hydrolase catalytic domain [Clostridiales bacterium]